MADRQKAVLITGCSSGIGRACAEHLTKSGYLVFAGVRKAQDALTLESLRLPGLVPLCPLDLQDPDQVAKAGERIERELEARKLPGLYAVVNNAGGGFLAPLELTDLTKLRGEMETRLLGPLALLQTLLPLLRRGGGRVLWIQTPSLMPIAFDASIHACDFAANCFSRTLQQELRPWNIPSIQIRCGCIRTPAVERSYEELHRSMAAWEAQGRGLYNDALQKLEGSLREMDKKRSDPMLIARTVLRALEAKKPRRRYRAGYLSGVSAVMECLPQPLVDWMMAMR